MRGARFALLAVTVALQAQMPESRAALAMEGSFLNDADPDQTNHLAFLNRVQLYRFAKAGKTLPPAAQALIEPITQAMNDGKFNQAWRMGTRFAVYASGTKWTDAHEAGSAYGFKVDRKVLAPGETLHLNAEPLFSLGRILNRPVTVQMGWRGQPLQSSTVESLNPIEVTLSTSGLPSGRHFAVFRLLQSGELITSAEREVFIEASWILRAEALQKALDSLSLKTPTPSQLVARSSAAYIAAQFSAARMGFPASFDEAWHPMLNRIQGDHPVTAGPLLHWAEDLARAEEFVRQLAAGGDPLRNARGDIRLALRAPDDSFTPVRVQIPATGDGPFPTILALHGAGGDENSFFDRYRNKDAPLLPQLAGNFLVICPAARSAYHKTAIAPAQMVLEELASSLPADREQTFLLGYSLGAFEVLTLAARAGDRYRGAAIAAGMADLTKLNLERTATLPLRAFGGSEDRIVLPADLRKFAALAKFRFASFEYSEIAGADHHTILFPALPRAVDFFKLLLKPRP